MTQPRTFHDRVAVALGDHIARIEMIREDKLNALDPAMFDALIEAAAWLREQREARVAILSGRGRMFCAGLDFGSFAAMAGEDGAASTSLEPRTHGLCNTPQYAAYAWHEAPVPVIVAIQGGALGGGLQIALGGDIRIAAPDAKIAIAETQWGLVPDMSGMARVRRLVRDDVLRELTYTNREFNGREAQAMGFATHVSDTPHEDALALAKIIANKHPAAMRGAKTLCNAMADLSDADLLMLESTEQLKVIRTPNQMEAVMAEMQKRKPVFAE